MPVTSRPSLAQSTFSGGQLADLPNFSPLLAEIPGGAETNQRLQEWWGNVRQRMVSFQSGNQSGLDNLRASSSSTFGTLSAEIATERIVRADADSSLATSISAVSAQLVTDVATLTASVTAEATARATADGFLAGKYTLTVTAGNVVTGMNITSQSGGGTNISSVIFQATDFKIYNGTTGIAMFNVSGSNVTLANTLVTSTSGKVFIGTGTYANTATPFYVDSIGRFSLKNNLTWDGVSALSIASTDKVLVTDNASYLTWQGSTGLNVPGIYLQHETGTGGGVNILAVGGATTSSAVFFTKARGAFGALSAILADDLIGVTAYQLYTGAAWTSVMTTRTGITASTGTPYHFINIGGVGTFNYYWIFNYDGKLYFSDTDLNPLNATPSSSLGAPYVADTTANIYRSALGTLKTDGNLVVAGGLVSATLGVAGLSLLGTVSAGAVTATSFSGNGASVTSLNASNLSSGTVAPARLGSGSGGSSKFLREDSTFQTLTSTTVGLSNVPNVDATNASNISSGTLSNSRLPAAISVTSLSTANFQASVGTAVDFISANLRGFNGATQTFRVDYTNGDIYIQFVRVIRAQYGTPNPGGSVDPVANWAAACLSYHGLGF